MERRTFLYGVAGSVVLGASACGDPSESVDPAPGDSVPTVAGNQRANVVVIYLDDMRLDGLDFMPKSRDLFDHEFTQARANGGACADTRMGLFTGTYILNHPWDILRLDDHDASKTWGPWMQAAGYRTGMFGKYITTDGWPFGRVDGWDTWRSYASEAHLPEGFKIDLGETPTAPIAPEGANLEYMIDSLKEFSLIEGQPFFATWNPQHPHADYMGRFNPRPENQDLYTDLPSPASLDEDITGKPEWVQELAPLTPEQLADLQRARQGQAQVLAGVDDAIAEFFEVLDEAGLRDDTVVFLSSDQGVHYGEHRWGAALGVPAGVQKGTLYEPVVRVPMLATGPGFPSGITTTPITQSDITATAVAIAGAEPSHLLDGIDMRTIVADPEHHDDRVLLLQSVVIFSPTPNHNSIVTGPDHSQYPLRKLGRLNTGETEFYDLGEDPGEFVNLVDVADRAEERDALLAILDTLLAG